MCAEAGKSLGGDSFGLAGKDGDEAPLLAAILELDDAGDLSKEGVILAAADVQAGLEWGAALADKNGAAGNSFAAKALHAEPLCV